jgi:hypothetical protein
MNKILSTTFFILLFCSVINTVNSQNDTTKSIIKKNTIFFEGYGNAGRMFYSINYERLFPLKSKCGISLRVVTSYAYKQGLFSFPILVNLMTGKRNSHFEIGLGCVSYIPVPYDNPYSDIDEFLVAPTGLIGYKYQRPDGGLFFKVSYTPVFYSAFYYQEQIDVAMGLLDIGVSLGYTF